MNNNNNNNNNGPVDLESGESLTSEQKTVLQQSSHPIALIFHLLFRTSAIVLYIVGNFLNSKVLLFVLLVLLLAFDFWTVKNVTGRLLVGLRWWNEIKEDGTNEWIFESRENRVANKVDSRIFWFSMYATTIIWSLFAFMKILSFLSLDFLITIVAITLNTANVIGYTKCEKDAKKKLQSYLAGNSMVSGMVSNMITSRITGFFGGAR